MKNKILKVAALSLVLVLVGCDDIVAKPKNGSDPLITFKDDKVYFQNNQDKIYDGLVDSSEFNSLTFDALLNKIIAKKVYTADEKTGKTFFKNPDTLKNELIEETLLKTIDSDAYKIDKLFYESKFIDSINSSLYGITKTTTHEGVAVKPDTKVEELLGNDYATVYKKYIDDKIVPEINKKLLTAKYICENSFSSLGRAYARKISYVKLENMSKKPGAASELINKWLGDFVTNGTTTYEETKDNATKKVFSLDSLARIYKGIAGETAAETAYIQNNEYYTLSKEISDEVKKIVADPENGDYTMKLDIDIDKSIEDKYTSNGSYSVEWGHELALRSLSEKKISDNGLFTKTNGISELPGKITERLFSSSVSSYLEKAYYMADGSNPYVTDAEGKKKPAEGAIEVSFLSPETSENGHDLGKYYFFDSDSNAYYIIVVEEYKYTSNSLKEAAVKGDDGTTIIQVDDDTARIAIELASSGSYSSDAVNAVLKEYKIAENIHDQNFYDYMKDTYGDIFDK